MQIWSREGGKLTVAGFLRRFAAVFLDRLRSMQRPRSMKTRGATAATELERQRGVAIGRRQRERRMRKTGACLFIRG